MTHEHLCPGVNWTDHDHRSTGELLACEACAKYNTRMCECDLIRRVRAYLIHLVSSLPSWCEEGQAWSDDNRVVLRRAVLARLNGESGV